METYLSTVQRLLVSAAAFLTMMGCGLGDVISDMIEPQFGFSEESVTIDRGNPAAVAMQFIDRLAAGDYIGASTHLCGEAVPAFYELDAADNVLLGADTSALIPVVDIAGDSATLSFDGEIILDPGTSDEFAIPGMLLPFSNIDMINLNGVWLLCPEELVE
jgi:hypothetical protein